MNGHWLKFGISSSSLWSRNLLTNRPSDLNLFLFRFLSFSTCCSNDFVIHWLKCIRITTLIYRRIPHKAKKKIIQIITARRLYLKERKQKHEKMECQAEAAALLPSFSELTSAGVVGRDRHGSPSDGSTDGSQQSQVSFFCHSMPLVCVLYLAWPFLIADSRINKPIDFQQSPWKWYVFFLFVQLSSTSESSAELSKELRLSSAHAMIFLSQQVTPLLVNYGSFDEAICICDIYIHKNDFNFWCAIP